MFEANPHPMWVHDIESRRFLAVNAAAIAQYGYTREEFLDMTIDDLRPPGDIPSLFDNVKAANGGLDRSGIWQHSTKAGTKIFVEIISHALDFEGHRAKVILAHDVTARQRAEGRSAGERAVLEMLASGAPTSEVLDRLALSYEEMFVESFCSVLLLDADGKHLRHSAAPSLNKAFCRALDCVGIGPAAGSCGTAAFTRRMTMAADIATDPLWKNYRDIPLSHGLRACWAVPIISSQDRVLGTFAVYYRQPQTPREEEIAALERGAHYASLAVERAQLIESLRDSQVRIETLVGNLPGMAYRCKNDALGTMSYVSDGCEAITG
jgi:PAS domain S-box-containing protein